MQFVRIDGEMSINQLQAAIDRFERYSNIRIMLITLGTGAIG